jgi:hypothetical protein
MKERLMTLVCALGALILFAAMFVHNDRGANGRGDVPRPTSAERRASGYHGAMAWLDEEHIRTMSFRERFQRLALHPGGLATGNLLIVTLPASTAFKSEEFRALESWVRAGNTLLVLAALSDNPDWAFVLARPASGDLGLLTGLEFERVQGRERRPGKHGADDVGARIAATARAFAQPQRSTLVPNGPYAYFEGVRAAAALSDYPGQAWAVKIPYDGFALSLASERETGAGVLWTRPLGNGRIIVSAFGSLFTNRALGLADNGRLLANLVGATLGPGGTVLFDDMHQGLGAAYDPAKFYADARLYQTVGIVAALWLCWVLGATKLHLPVTRAPVPREAELVKATGGFLARVLTTDAGARGLFGQFFRRIAERLPPGRAKGNPPWELLDGQPGITSTELRQLRGWYADACATRRVPLGRLHNLILKINRHL